jgi:transposase
LEIANRYTGRDDCLNAEREGADDQNPKGVTHMTTLKQNKNVLSDREELLEIRFRMVRRAEETSVSEAARAYGTTRKTVRLWLRRYREKGIGGLRDRSRAPKHIPHKKPLWFEKQVLAIREAIPGCGPDRMIREFGLKASTATIARILKENGKIKKRKSSRPPVEISADIQPAAIPEVCWALENDN